MRGGVQEFKEFEEFKERGREPGVRIRESRGDPAPGIANSR
jgi:hypothetical protein